MFVAYRGFSVIAPIAAIGAVFLTDPHAVPAAFTSLFMDKMVGFARLYFPVFLLGAVFGKVIETSGFAKSIVHTIISVVGKQQAIMAIVLVCAVLTYGGVSLFVVVFAAYPFATELFRAANIPKRLILARSRLARSPSPWTRRHSPHRPRTSFRPPISIRPPPRGARNHRRDLHLRLRDRLSRVAQARGARAFLPLIVVFALNIARRLSWGV